MCLIVIGFRAHEHYPLIVAGNRDEFHDRPTQSARWWADKPDIAGGRDLKAGGTWLALHRGGRFATVTNFQGAKLESGKLKSRGLLVADFLECGLSPLEYLESIDGEAYAGFNLLVSDGRALGYLSNRGIDARLLDPGVYGLSNATLDAPWHKVERSKAVLQGLLDTDAVNETELLRLLSDRARGPSSEVKSGRLPFARAHALTAPFVVLPDYGTRCSSAVLADSDGRWQLLERQFDADGNARGDTQLSFTSQS